jgi:hypothetical protein
VGASWGSVLKLLRGLFVGIIRPESVLFPLATYYRRHFLNSPNSDTNPLRILAVPGSGRPIGPSEPLASSELACLLDGQQSFAVSGFRYERSFPGGPDDSHQTRNFPRDDEASELDARADQTHGCRPVCSKFDVGVPNRPRARPSIEVTQFGGKPLAGEPEPIPMEASIPCIADPTDYADRHDCRFSSISRSGTSR